MYVPVDAPCNICDEEAYAEIKRMNLDGSKIETFAQGWLSENKKEVLGRPNYVLVKPDGSMLVSDDHANKIYRIAYPAQ